jgi:hypothetical protein
VETAQSLAGAGTALPDSRSNNPHCPGHAFQKVHIHLLGAAIFENKSANVGATG